MTAELARADVVIPAYNEERTLPRCLRAVRSSMNAAGLQGQIFVVDDASTDETVAAAEAAGAVVVRQETRGGPLRAWMAGVAASDAGWIVFTDADCHLDLAAFEELSVGFADHTAGVIAGRSVPESVSGTGGPVLWSAQFSSVLLHEIKSRLSDHDFQPIGRLMAVRREYWTVDQTTAGPCDRSVTHAARAAGGRVVYRPSAVVYYTPVTDWRDLTKDYFRTVHSKAADRYHFDQIPRSIEVRAAIRSTFKAPRGAASWALCRVAFRSRASGGRSSSDVALRWNAGIKMASDRPKRPVTQEDEKKL